MQVVFGPVWALVISVVIIFVGSAIILVLIGALVGRCADQSYRHDDAAKIAQWGCVAKQLLGRIIEPFWLFRLGIADRNARKKASRQNLEPSNR